MKGFSTLGLLILMPFLILSLAAVSSSWLIVAQYTEIQSSCRNLLLQTQKVLADHLNLILSLNPKAHFLRKEEKALRLAILAATHNPPLLAKLTHRFSQNIATQKQLRIQMESLKTQGESQARRHLLTHRKNLTVPLRPTLHLKKEPAVAIAPNFNPMPFFERLQNLKIHWTLNPPNLLPQWLPLGKYQGQCSTTLIRKGKLWTPSLSADKF